jgi:L-alanine-DL-glutamate epimerase-like enolase superfamily enzyme
MRLEIEKQSWALAAPFRFAGYEVKSSDVVIVTLIDGDFRGRGEATGVIYRGETPDSIVQQISALSGRLEAGLDRQALQTALPAGGARNAVDCALWDLECKRQGRTIWDLLRRAPKPVLTCNTVGLDPLPTARARAATLSDYGLLKVKVDRDHPIERLQAVRAVRPDVRLIIDVNGAWDIDTLQRVLEPLMAIGIEMIEQPLPPGGDAALDGLNSPIPLCADESCFVAADLAALRERYSVVNIKLDKCGGLTEALELGEAAKRRGLDLMVGNMIGTSLSMAPSFVIAQDCRYCDLDGPLALVQDRPDALRYNCGEVSIPTARLWG